MNKESNDIIGDFAGGECSVSTFMSDVKDSNALYAGHKAVRGPCGEVGYYIQSWMR